MTVPASEAQANRDLKTTATWLLVAFFLGQSALLLRFILQNHGDHLKAAEALRSGGTFALGVATTTLGYTTATGFVWSLAWVTAGFLFGFVFGIPKVIAGQAGSTLPADPSASPAKLRVNTNLEDISDWLTKILVGATLTQITRIPGMIATYARYMANYDTSSVSFNAALLVYYSALGLLSGYILTRMFFARAFAVADQGPAQLSPDAAKLLDEASIAFGRSLESKSNSSLREAADASNRVPITKALSSSDAIRLAKGASLAMDPRRALDASEIAIKKSPHDPEALLTYAWTLQQSGSDTSAVLPVVLDAARNTSTSTDRSILISVYQSLSYLQLYQPPPIGFNEALKTIAEYESKGGQPDAGIEINRACAFGQMYCYLLNNNSGELPEQASKQKLDEASSGALTAIKTALHLEPASAQRLKELLWVLGDPADDDLSCFQDDTRFTSLLPKP